MAPADPAGKPGATPVYTRQGDQGKTRLVGGQSCNKDEPRIEAYGAVDELNALVGLARAEAIAAGMEDELGAPLQEVQNRLFDLGSELATLPQDRSDTMPLVGADHVTALEQEMDRCSAQLPPLRNFILPGPGRLNATLHLARTVCRRAERRALPILRDDGCRPEVVQYLNRLSDALFVWARFAAHAAGEGETPWRSAPDASER